MSADPQRSHGANTAVLLGQRLIEDANEIIEGAGLLHDPMECSAVLRAAVVALVDAAMTWDTRIRVKVIGQLAEVEAEHPGRKIPPPEAP
jgi:hypothetical protein